MAMALQILTLEERFLELRGELFTKEQTQIVIGIAVTLLQLLLLRGDVPIRAKDIRVLTSSYTPRCSESGAWVKEQRARHSGASEMQVLTQNRHVVVKFLRSREPDEIGFVEGKQRDAHT
eukprot:768772-Hanusia_phi.AAC.11